MQSPEDAGLNRRHVASLPPASLCFFKGRRQAAPSLITPFPVSTQHGEEADSLQLFSPQNTSYRQDLTTAKFTRPRRSCHLVAICHPAPSSPGRGTRVALGTRL